MRQAGFEPQASEAANAAEAEPTTFGSGDQHGQRTPALAVAVSRVSESRRRPSTTNDAFSVTIVVTEADGSLAPVDECKGVHGRRPSALKVR